jgi:hypothetical protein
MKHRQSALKLIKRRSRLTQLSTSIGRYAKRRKPMLHFSNKRPDKWDHLLATGKI